MLRRVPQVENQGCSEGVCVQPHFTSTLEGDPLRALAWLLFGSMNQQQELLAPLGILRRDQFGWRTSGQRQPWHHLGMGVSARSGTNPYKAGREVCLFPLQSKSREHRTYKSRLHNLL